MKNKTMMLIASIIIIITLCLVRVTGVFIHIMLGIIFTSILIYHFYKKREHRHLIKSSWKKTNILLLVLVIVIICSGLAMKIEAISFYALLIHKTSSLVFIAGTALHIKQHIMYWKVKKDVQ